MEKIGGKSVKYSVEKSVEKSLQKWLEESVKKLVENHYKNRWKHVLHLVWSAYVISTAISTDLKVAGESKILGKEGQHYRKRKICFGQYR